MATKKNFFLVKVGDPFGGNHVVFFWKESCERDKTLALG
jgi:hypothetical protein